MKKICVILLAALVLCGCRGDNDEFDQAMKVRTGLLNAGGCQFEAVITADFSERAYTFAMACRSDEKGDLDFEVLEPEDISGITGSIDFEGGKLIFDDTVLAFALQTEGILSPVSAPWILIRALRSGYVRYCTREDGLLRLTVDDSYEDDALMLDIWINEMGQPVQADVYGNNRRILSLIVRNYRLV